MIKGNKKYSGGKMQELAQEWGEDYTDFSFHHKK